MENSLLYVKTDQCAIRKSKRQHLLKISLFDVTFNSNKNQFFFLFFDIGPMPVRRYPAIGHRRSWQNVFRVPYVRQTDKQRRTETDIVIRILDESSDRSHRHATQT